MTLNWRHLVMVVLMVPGSLQWDIPEVKRPAVTPEEVKSIIVDSCAYLGRNKTDYRFPNRPSNRGSIDRFLQCKRDIEKLLDGPTKPYPPEILWAARVCGPRCNVDHLGAANAALANAWKLDEWSDRLVDMIITVSMRDGLGLYDFMTKLVDYAPSDFWDNNSRNGLFKDSATIFDIAADGDIFNAPQDQAEVGFYHYRKWTERRSREYRCLPRVALRVLGYFATYKMEIDKHCLQAHYDGMFDVICSPSQKQWTYSLFFRVLNALFEAKVRIEKALMVARVGAVAFQSAASGKSKENGDNAIRSVVQRMVVPCEDPGCMVAAGHAIMEEAAKRKEERQARRREREQQQEAAASRPEAATAPEGQGGGEGGQSRRGDLYQPPPPPAAQGENRQTSDPAAPRNAGTLAAALSLPQG